MDVVVFFLRLGRCDGLGVAWFGQAGTMNFIFGRFQKSERGTDDIALPNGRGDFENGSGTGSGDFHRCLVGIDFEDLLIRCDFVAGRDFDIHDGCFRHGFSQLWHMDGHTRHCLIKGDFQEK